MPSSSVTGRTAPPRLAERRERAWSTKTHRIALAATPKSGLQRVARTLLVHMTAGHPAQLGVDQRHEAIERRLVAVAPLVEQLRDVVRRRRHYPRPVELPQSISPGLGDGLLFCHEGSWRSSGQGLVSVRPPITLRLERTDRDESGQHPYR